MAISLSRSFRSCSSFAFVGRRNQHSNSVPAKTSNSLSPYTKEMNFWDQTPVSVPRNYEISFKTMSNLQVFPDSVFCVQKCKVYKKVQKDPYHNLKRADKDQLQHITNILIEDLPELFNRNMNYDIYHPDMTFENNIRGTKTIGIISYMREMLVLKIIGNIRFSNVRLTILKITDHPEDGTVRVRWRIVGVSQLRNILRMIKQMSQKNLEPEGWYDGFSIFYVRSDGLIHKHIADKMIPDNSEREKYTALRNRLAEKMAFTVGIAVKDFSFATSSFEKAQDKSTCPNKVIYSLEGKKPFLKVKFSESALENK